MRSEFMSKAELKPDVSLTLFNMNALLRVRHHYLSIAVAKGKHRNRGDFDRTAKLWLCIQ